MTQRSLAVAVGLSLSLLSLTSGCDTPSAPTSRGTPMTPAGYGSYDYAPGPGAATSCAPDLLECVGADDIAFCDAGVEAIVTCESVCDDAGYDLSAGCDFDSESDSDVCFCDYRCDDSREPALCLDELNLERCDGGTWVVDDCEETCQALGFIGAIACEEGAAGSEDACVCEAPSPPPPPTPPPAPSCYEGAATCLASDLLEVCEGGATVALDCRTVCAESGYDFAEACAYDPSIGEDSCFCGEYVCAESELTCSDGSCLDSAYICDGYADCPGGDDEWSCAPPPPECAPDGTRCADANNLEVCDQGALDFISCDTLCADEGFDFADGCGFDQGFGEDACFCSTFSCAPNQFTCGDGTCLSDAYVCDGYADCGGAEDEAGCVPIGCAEDEFTCGDGSCIPATYICDSYSDCPGAEDELTCSAPPQCYPDELACNDGSCIPAYYECDGYYDCPGAEDELYCD